MSFDGQECVGLVMAEIQQTCHRVSLDTPVVVIRGLSLHHSLLEVLDLLGE